MIRKVVILQGVSGSGKSTWARAQPNARIVSADDAIYDEKGVYCFTPEKQALGHKQCLREFARYVTEPHVAWRWPEDGAGFATAFPIHTIIVDNTNTRAFFMAPYVSLARAFDLPVEIMSFRAPLEVCAARNAGRAPFSIVKEMVETIATFTMPEQWARDGVTYTVVETGG